MASTILGGLWQTGLYKQTESTTLHSNFMSALDQYISEDVTFKGTFSGVDSEGNTKVTDITSKIDTGNLGSEISTCGDPNGGDGYAQWKAWIEQVYGFITSDCGLKPEIFIPDSPIPCFNLKTCVTWDRPDLLTAINGNEENPQTPLLDRMAQGFMDDMKIEYIPSFTGKVDNYIGTLTITEVETK